MTSWLIDRFRQLLKSPSALLLALALWPPAFLIAAPNPVANGPVEITGTLEVVQVCNFSQHTGERWYDLIEDKTGERHRLKFEVEPAAGHLTGERVRVRGRFQGNAFSVSADADNGMEVLAEPPTQNHRQKSGPITEEILYPGGTNANTVVRKTLVQLLLYSDYAANYYTQSSITSYSNLFFAATGNSVNTSYLEDTYGAVGFAGDVVICHIADTSGDYNIGTWMSQGDAAAAAQGYNTGSYANKVYITSGAGGWAGLAAVGGNWSLDFYTDGGTICHELGHNLGFNHASTQWNNTGAWDEYGDSSDFMGGSYDWRHNNGPHKVQRGWVTAQPVTHAGTYQLSRLEDVPSTVPYPQVLTVPAGSAPNGWPYYFSYKQSVGFDANIGSGYNKGLSIHRWGGGGANTAAIAVLADGDIFTDSGVALTVKQISHDTNSVTVVITTCVGAAQPYTIAMTSPQLAARTTVLADVAVSCDLMTITNFDSVSAQGGTITKTNNQLFYKPPGSFSGNDTFTYTLTNSYGQSSSSTVTIYQITQPAYIWDANGVAEGAGGSGTWDTVSTNWDNGVNVWPGSGSANWAVFGGSTGNASIASGGVSANGLDFKTDGYVIQNSTLTLNGANPTVMVEPNVNATISSVVGASAGFTKLGQGTLTLSGTSGTSTYSGPTTVSNGTLTVANGLGVYGSSYNYTGAVVVASGATLNLATTFSGSPGFQNFSGPLSGAGAINATGRGGGGYRFTSDGTAFTGALNANVGSGNFFAGATTFLNANVTVTGANGVYGFSALSGVTAQIGSLSGAGIVGADTGACTFQVGNLNTDTLFSGVIKDNATTGGGVASLTKVGTGTLTLSGANTYTGATTIRAGKLAVTTAQTGAGAFTVNDGATLSVTVSGTNQLSPLTLIEGSSVGLATNEFTGLTSTLAAPVKAGTLTLKGATTINIVSGTLTAGQTYPLISFTTINGAGGFNLGTLPYVGVVAALVTNGGSIALNVTALMPLVWDGNANGTWDIANTANWKAMGGATTYSDGSPVQFDDTASGTTTVTNTVTVSPASITVSNVTKSYTIGPGAISGSGGLTKLGQGALTLSGTSAYTGNTTISQGTLIFASTAAFGTSSVILGGGGGNVALLENVAGYMSRNITVNPQAGGKVTVGDVSTFNAGGTLHGFSGGITLNGDVTLQSSPDSIGNRTDFSGPITGAGNVTIADPTGNGYAVIFGNNNNNNSLSNAWLGNLVINPTAKLQIGAGTAVGDGIPDTATVTVNGRLSIAKNGNETIDALNGASTGLISRNASSDALTIGAAGGSGSFAGVISGSIPITKIGAGTQTFTGVNTYTGATTVNNGTLRVNGSLAAASAVAVSAAGTLGGSGTVNGPVTINGAIAPGTGAVGTLATGVETWNAGGRYVCELNATNATGCDRLNITGALNVQSTAGSPFTLKLVSLTSGNTPGLLTDFNKFSTYVWTIATASGGIANFASNKFVLDTASLSNEFSGGAFSLAVVGNNLVANYTPATAVPPAFTGISNLGAGGMQLGGTGGVGQVYVLFATTNIAQAVWTSIATNPADTNGVFQFTDPQATNFGQRFYRLALP